MSIELQSFHRTRITIKAIKYEGPKMDWDLSIKYRNAFSFAYDYQGSKYLIPAYRGLKGPHTGDWLIFDESGHNLIDVMPSDLFSKTYEPAKEVQ